MRTFGRISYSTERSIYVKEINEVNKIIRDQLQFARAMSRAWRRCHIILKVAPHLRFEILDHAYNNNLQALKKFYKRYENILSLEKKNEKE
jgi:hypothetical protein